MGSNQQDAWETAPGAVTSEAFLAIPGALDASKNGWRFGQSFRARLASSSSEQNLSVLEMRSSIEPPNVQRRMSTERTKTTDGDPLLERIFHVAKRPVPSLSEIFHPWVQKQSTLQCIYQIYQVSRCVRSILRPEKAGIPRSSGRWTYTWWVLQAAWRAMYSGNENALPDIHADFLGFTWKSGLAHFRWKSSWESPWNDFRSRSRSSSIFLEKLNIYLKWARPWKFVLVWSNLPVTSYWWLMCFYNV